MGKSRVCGKFLRPRHAPNSVFDDPPTSDVYAYIFHSRRSIPLLLRVSIRVFTEIEVFNAVNFLGFVINSFSRPFLSFFLDLVVNLVVINVILLNWICLDLFFIQVYVFWVGFWSREPLLCRRYRVWENCEQERRRKSVGRFGFYFPTMV